jgi:hypothetical protein
MVLPRPPADPIHVALPLTVPFVVLTGVALILTARGRLCWASAVALLSILLMWLAWRQA